MRVQDSFGNAYFYLIKHMAESERRKKVKNFQKKKI